MLTLHTQQPLRSKRRRGSRHDSAKPYHRQTDRQTDTHTHTKTCAHAAAVELALSSVLQEEKYNVQVVQVTTVLRTLMLTGETASGLHYQRCIRGNWLSHGDMALPINLQRLRIEVAYSNIPYGIPQSSPLADRFSTVYLPMQKADCEQYCIQQRGCFESRIASTNGCFFIFGPSPLTLSCEELHAKDHVDSYPASLAAELCDRANCSFLRQGSFRQHLVSELLDSSISFSAVSLKTYINSSGSVFPLKQSQMALHQGTPPLKAVLAESGQSDFKVGVRVGKLNFGLLFDIVLDYDPTDTTASWNTSSFDLTLAAILEDSSFLLDWHSATASASHKLRFQQCDEALYLRSYVACGGHFDSPMTTIKVDSWAPSRSVYATLNPTEYAASWFQNVEVEVRLRTAENLQPLQSLIRRSCSVPICLGGFNECLIELKCGKKQSCFHSCNQRAIKNCTRLRGNGSQFVAAIIPTYGADVPEVHAKRLARKAEALTSPVSGSGLRFG